MLLSRVADSLYWMNRYLERTEHSSRLIMSNLNITLDQSPKSSVSNWKHVIRCLHGSLDEEQMKDVSAITDYLTFDLDNPYSLASCMGLARENTRQIREQVSSEMWEQINRLYWKLKRSNNDMVWNSQPDMFYQSVQESAQLIFGVTYSTMNHGEGWHFIQVGRCLERIFQMTRQMSIYFQDIGAGGEPGGLDEITLLKSCGAFDAYCKKYTADVRRDRIVDFLVLNPEYPRSIRFAIDRLHRSIKGIVESDDTHQSTKLIRQSGRLLANADYTSVEEVMAGGLPSFMDSLSKQCQEIHETLTRTYIAYPIETTYIHESYPRMAIS